MIARAQRRAQAGHRPSPGKAARSAARAAADYARSIEASAAATTLSSRRASPPPREVGRGAGRPLPPPPAAAGGDAAPPSPQRDDWWGPTGDSDSDSTSVADSSSFDDADADGDYVDDRTLHRAALAARSPAAAIGSPFMGGASGIEGFAGALAFNR